VPAVIATATREGRPSARAVVVEAADERGFAFWSSDDSPTGRDLAANPRAALVFLWDGRQARVEGAVELASDGENERHWQEREGKRQLAAFHQSEPVASRGELERLVERQPAEPDRPSSWIGYRVIPERFDFWVEDDEYVHDRFEYTRDGDGWRIARLQP
jgi:pyridoxamine 5'-phosphate oxidase